MSHIKIKKGLDIPIKGAPNTFFEGMRKGRLSALDLSCFENQKFTLLVKEGDEVKIGQCIAEDKASSERKFVSPSSGRIQKIHRGLKRRLLYIEIEHGKGEEYIERKPFTSSSREEIIHFLAETGLFPHIGKRPCHRMADLTDKPKSIFIKALETAPFSPAPELEIKGFEEEFTHGVKLLQSLTEGKVHLIHRPGSSFAQTEGVECHTIEGPHPGGNPSLHIYHIDPIASIAEVVWTLTVHDVICIGMMALKGKYHNTRVIGLAGEGVEEKLRGFYRVQKGINIGELLEGNSALEERRIISGDPLMGSKVGMDAFLGFHHNICCVIFEPKEREFIHFLKARTKFFTATRTYFSKRKPPVSFNTLAHGEVRAFVDGGIYEKVMPMDIPTMHFVKALLAEDYEKAEELGLLEVDSEDFALPTFICPSKIDMISIVKEGQMKYAAEYLS